MLQFLGVSSARRVTVTPLVSGSDSAGNGFTAEFTYPAYTFEGQGVPNAGVSGEWNYPAYTVDGLATDEPIVKPALTLGVAEPGQIILRALLTDTEVFALSQPFVGNWSYPAYTVAGRIDFVGVAVGEWEYPVAYSVEGELVAENGIVDTVFDYPEYGFDAFVQQNGALDGSWDYPAYTLEGYTDRNFVLASAWDYPTYSVEGALSQAAGIGAWDYPAYDLDGDVLQGGGVIGFWNYPIYSMIADFNQIFPADGDFDYPSTYVSDGDLLQTNLVGGPWFWSYPTYGFDGSAAADGTIRAEWYYPAYDLDASLRQNGAFSGAFDYPQYGFDGLILGYTATGSWQYGTPYGVSDQFFETYTVRGVLEIGAYLRATFNYPRYSAEGAVDFVGQSVGIWTYPGYSMFNSGTRRLRNLAMVQIL